MPYSVHELFYTLQGEGAQVGRPAVFLRFTGCNLWTGHERDRLSAVCQFCDTEFVGIDGQGGGRFESASSLAQAAKRTWPTSGQNPFVVCTGGEPLLQLDVPLVEALHEQGFEVALETNGTLPAPPGIDWVCVSPKANTELVLTTGNELKLVYPQEGAEPAMYEGLPFDHFFLQPMDGPHLEEYTRSALEFCLAHPKWRLSLQTHKILGIR